MPRVAERGEVLVLRIVDQDVAVGEIQDLRPAVDSPLRFQRADQSFQQIWKATTVLPVPVARVSSIRFLPCSDRLNGAVDGDLLVVAKGLRPVVETRASAAARPPASSTHALGTAQARPELVRRREIVDRPLDPGRVVELDDLDAVGGVGELQAQDLGVFLGLLKPVRCMPVAGLGLDDRDREVRADSGAGSPSRFCLPASALPPTKTIRPSVKVLCSLIA